MTRENLTRRRFLATGLASLAVPSLAACGLKRNGTEPYEGNPRLEARPGSPTGTVETGAIQLGIEIGRDGILWAPRSYTPDVSAPLMVTLHGAGGSAGDWSAFQSHCEERGIILLAVDSRGSTWDRVRGPFGPDVFFIDQALAYCFERCNVDASRLCLGGFSDGASYALSLGVSNGDLFTHLVAFSPGFFWPADPIVGKPRVFVSHGRSDPVLSVAASRDHIVPMLEGDGYEVTYREFEGGHEVPASIANEALDWVIG
jgi:phospholipase/carboxylesterase